MMLRLVTGVCGSFIYLLCGCGIFCGVEYMYVCGVFCRDVVVDCGMWSLMCGERLSYICCCYC